MAVFITDAPVEVPFHIGDGRALQHVGNAFDQIILHVLPGKIEDELVAAEHRVPSGNRHRPFGMGPVQVAVDGNAFRLEPDAEPEAQSRDALSQLLQGAAKLFFIGIPVAQAGIVAVTLSKPAVVHDEKLDSQLRRILRDVHQLVSGEVKIGSFPVIDQHGPAAVLPLAATDVVTDQPVEDPADAALPLAAVGHQHLRRSEALAGLQLPGKIIRMNAADQPGLVHLILLRLHQEFPAVNKGEAVAVSPLLIRILSADHHKGIVVMAGRAAHASDGLHAVSDPGSLKVSLHRVPAMEGEPVIVARLPVQAEARGFQKGHALLSLIDDPGRPGDHIQFFKYAVIQAYRHAALLILQLHRQRFRLLRRSVCRRKAGQVIFSLFDAVARIAQGDRPASVRVLHLQRADPVVPRSEAGIFLREGIQRIGPVRAAHGEGISGKAPVSPCNQTGQVGIVRLFSVKRVKQNPLSVRFHLVGAVSGLQGENPAVFLIKDAHIRFPFCRRSGIPARCEETRPILSWFMAFLQHTIKRSAQQSKN